MALVHAAISTSAPILDLSSQKPLKIQIRLTLQNDNPITFQNSQSGLFDGRLLFQGGLTFIDVSDNTEVSRNHLHLCRLEGEAETLTESTADEFTTLFPGQPHEIETQFNFITVPSDGPQSWPGMTAEEWLDKKEAMPSNDVQKWPNTHGFQDGRTYEIQVSSEAAIKNWWEESKQDLMKTQTWIGFASHLWRGNQAHVKDMKKGCIRFHVLDTAQFTIKRPDTDGSLTFP